MLCLYLDVAISKHPGESHKQALRRFISFERSLHAKNLFVDFKPVTEEYFFKWPLSGLQSTPTSSWCSIVGARILGAEWSMKHQRHNVFG